MHYNVDKPSWSVYSVFDLQCNSWKQRKRSFSPAYYIKCCAHGVANCVKITRLTSISSNKIIKLRENFMWPLSHVIPLMKTIPYLSHARSWSRFCVTSSLALDNWGQNVKLLAISQTRQFYIFLTDLPSNFWTIARLLGKIKHTVSF